jgi:hypothetical protein
MASPYILSIYADKSEKYLNSYVKKIILKLSIHLYTPCTPIHSESIKLRLIIVLHELSVCLEHHRGFFGYLLCILKTIADLIVFILVRHTYRI